ncbi:hypothetical protein GGH95_003553 [Coemansia sp. RSA 1836]|nr:hypothetical protein GGH95_003553 [Coemansia sp. RSA 1836]
MAMLFHPSRLVATATAIAPPPPPPPPSSAVFAPAAGLDLSQMPVFVRHHANPLMSPPFHVPALSSATTQIQLRQTSRPHDMSANNSNLPRLSFLPSAEPAAQNPTSSETPQPPSSTSASSSGPNYFYYLS